MLFFCEECGGKNMVADGSANRGKIRFRCQFCHYETVVEAGEVKTPAGEASKDSFAETQGTDSCRGTNVGK